jgi:hypothetical protein
VLSQRGRVFHQRAGQGAHQRVRDDAGDEVAKVAIAEPGTRVWKRTTGDDKER